MRKKKNLLDERQELTLMHIEHSGFWIAFYGLAILIVAQIVICQYDFSHYAGETILLVAVSVYFLVNCMKHGIWDRHLQADTRTNAIISVVAAVISGVIIFISKLRSNPETTFALFTSAGLSMLFIFALCFSVLELLSRVVKKRQERLEAEPPEEAEDDRN